MAYFAGIDGGGTKTECIVGNAEREQKDQNFDKDRAAKHLSPSRCGILRGRVYWFVAFVPFVAFVAFAAGSSGGRI